MRVICKNSVQDVEIKVNGNCTGDKRMLFTKDRIYEVMEQDFYATENNIPLFTCETYDYLIVKNDQNSYYAISCVHKNKKRNWFSDKFFEENFDFC